MSFGVLILLLVACILGVLIVFIGKLMSTDDFAEDDVVATYERIGGMAPSRMVKAGDSFCMIYEDNAYGKYGMGLGMKLDDMNLIYEGDNARILDVKAQDDYIVWSELKNGSAVVRAHLIFSGETQVLSDYPESVHVPGAVGLHNYCAYFGELSEDEDKVNIIAHNLETGDRRVIESVHIVPDVARALVSFKISHNIMNLVEQDLVNEMKLVAVDLNSMVRSENVVSVAGFPEERSLVVDTIGDVTPNLDRMTYIAYVKQKGKGMVYEVGDKKSIKCVMVGGKFISDSLNCSQGVAYWMEETGTNDNAKTMLYGFNTRSRQLIIKIAGVSSYIVDDEDIYYFHENAKTGKLTLCRRHAAGNIRTIDMAAAKAEYKEKKKANKNK